jgi:kumamolisin
VGAHGFEVVQESPSRTSLNIRGTVASIEKAFGTRLDEYQDSRGRFRAPATALQLDATFSRVVVAMMGLDDALLPQPLAHPPPPNAPQANNGSQTPPDLEARYGVDVAGTMYGVHGEGQTLAILGAGDPPSLTKDIDPFVNKYKPLVSFDRTTQYTQILLGGPNRDPDTLAQTEYGENVLDIDMAMGMAPAASVIHVITATNSYLFEQGIPYIVNQIPQAHAVSVSYGSCERGAAEFELITLDQLFQQAKAQGQQWFFATGDNGTDGCQDMTSNAILSPGWPTTSIYVMGVGGTQLSAGVEQAWTDGGGGQSEIVDKPAYQDGIGPYPNDGVRDTPDVAALAGNPGVTIYAQGAAQPGWQGTSVATPLFASTWVLLDQSQGGHGLRNSHEEIYKLGAAGLGFHDITKGNNGGATPGYNALPGYDLATGWGSPDLPSLIANWTN